MISGQTLRVCAEGKPVSPFPDHALPLRHRFVLGPRIKRHSDLFGAHESPADIPVFRTGIERNQTIAVLAVRLKPVADFLRALSEYLGAFRAFDFYFFFNHEICPANRSQHSAFPRLRACLRIC
jgi:hypothetical protein